MSQVTIDAALLARLNGLTQETEFRDENGRLLGHFVPAVEDEEEGLFVPPPEDKCPYTPEELHRMRHSTGGMTLAEFWKMMGVKSTTPSPGWPSP